MNVEISKAATRPGSERLARVLNPWLLGLALLAFVLPFASVSCATPRGFGSAGGGVTASYAGTTLAFGGAPTVESGPDGLAPGPLTPEDTIPGQIAVTLTLAMVAAAFAISVLRADRLPAIGAMAAAAAVALVIGVSNFDIWLTGRIVNRLEALGVEPQAGNDPADYVRPGIGVGIVLLWLVLAVLVNGFASLRRRRSRP